MEHYYNHGTNEHNCCREPGSCTCECSCCIRGRLEWLRDVERPEAQATLDTIDQKIAALQAIEASQS